MNSDHYFTDADRCRLGRMLLSDDVRGMAPWQVLYKLEILLEDAEAMQAKSIPDDVVTMNSTIRLVNDDSAEQIICTIVYPEDFELVDNGVSVLEPLGTHTIGCKVGDLVECEGRRDHGPWRVDDILFQPERSGAFHL